MILVTGGTGLVGSHLLYKLTKESNNIRAIYRSEDKLEQVKKIFSYYTDDFLMLFKKIEWVKADITDICSLESVFSIEVKFVYHCAAVVSFDPKDYFKMRKANIEGTANIVNFCVDNKVKKLCHVSSIAALGAGVGNKVITEETERNQLKDESGYSITKYGAETEVWRASQEGVDVVIVNPGVILGAGFFNEGSGKMFTKVYEGINYYTNGVTGFIGIKDVVKTMSFLMNSEVRNERFVLVAENKSFKEVLFLIADNFNKKRPKFEVKKNVMSLFWRIDWCLTKITGKAPLLTKNSAKSSQSKTYYSADKINKVQGVAFESIALAIKDVCDKYDF